ncbi:MAG: hypothetical protein JRJ77_00875 [Deltaproteobacteria bacterium]|nr:hypothetical protein [Deltaproteobacteria bacterium]
MEWEGAEVLEEASDLGDILPRGLMLAWEGEAYPEAGPIGPQGLPLMPLMEDIAINRPMLLMVCGRETRMVILIRKK